MTAGGVDVQGFRDVRGRASAAGSRTATHGHLACFAICRRPHAGLSAWDKHVGYRNLRMHPVLHPPPSSPPPKQQRAASGDARGGGAAWGGPSLSAESSAAAPPPSAVPSLLDCCQAELLRGLHPGSVCDVLQVADSLAPVLDGLRARAVECAAQSFSALLAHDPEGFCALSTETLAEVLCSQSLVRASRRRGGRGAPPPPAAPAAPAGCLRPAKLSFHTRPRALRPSSATAPTQPSTCTLIHPSSHAGLPGEGGV